MTDLATKQQILEDGGFFYEPWRELYINRKMKKVFSVDFIEEHPASELEEKVRRAVDGKTWQFFFNSDPEDSVRRELETLLG